MGKNLAAPDIFRATHGADGYSVRRKAKTRCDNQKMIDAFDTIKGRRVWAASAGLSRLPDQYICPICQTEVVFASGETVASHFRHRRGTDHEACERYSRYFHVEVPFASHEYEHHDLVLVAEYTRSSAVTHVSIAAKLRTDLDVETLIINTGGVPRTYTIHHRLGEQYFAITSADEKFLARFNLRDGSSEVQLLDGFGSKPLVFRSAADEAVRIPEHHTLKPGSYTIVGKVTLEGRFHLSLQPKQLTTTKGFHATEITIPDDPSFLLRSNLQSIIGFDISPTIATYALLSPHTVQELATDCWRVNDDDDVEILVRLSQHVSIKSTRLIVQRRDLGHLSTKLLTLEGLSNTIAIRFDAKKSRSELYRIGLAEPARFILELHRSKRFLEPKCARIEFCFRIQSTERSRLSWSSHRLAEALLDVSRGKMDLEMIRLPNSIEMSICDQKGRRTVLSDHNAARELTLILLTRRFPYVLAATGYPDLWLDFTPFVTSQEFGKKSPAILNSSTRGLRLQDAYQRRFASSYAASI